jgi:peptide-methionine (S)-S-oxide reductase
MVCCTYRNPCILEVPMHKGEHTMRKTAVFAGGCFWGLEELIRSQPGVLDTTVGYTGGTVEHPTYDNHAGHAEAVEIVYDPTLTSYKKLLDFFFQIHNPTTRNQQGNDVSCTRHSHLSHSSTLQGDGPIP